MQTVHIQPVTTSRQRREFLDVPMTLHGSDCNWAPSLRWDESRLLGFSSGHPVTKQYQIDCWIAYRGNRAVGRVASVLPRHSHEHQPSRQASFGFLAVEDDLHTTQQLLRTVAEHVSKSGFEHFAGPFSPSINYSVGVLHSGAVEQPSFQLPCNPEYYCRLLEECGLNCVQELYALQLSGQKLASATTRLERVADRLSKRYNVHFRSLDRWNARRDIRTFLTIAQQSLHSHWGFVPLSEAEQEQLVSDLFWTVSPNLLQFAEIDGQVVGAALALPDLAPCLKATHGKLSLSALLKLWWAKRHSTRYRVVAANILPNYTRLGLAPALIGRIHRHAIQSGARSIEYSWIAESNPLSFGTIENGGARRTKVMRIYDGDCDRLLNNCSSFDAMVASNASEASLSISTGDRSRLSLQ